jgi:hypothetical protein
VKVEADRPVDAAAGDGEHQQRGSDRERERQAEQQHERGHDQEAAADAEEAGQDARAETGGRDAHEREIAAGLGWVVGPAAQHRRRGGEQEQREGEQQRPPVDESVECGAGDRSGRARRAEGERGLDLDAAVADVVGGGDQGGGADDQQ